MNRRDLIQAVIVAPFVAEPDVPHLDAATLSLLADHGATQGDGWTVHEGETVYFCDDEDRSPFLAIDWHLDATV